MSPKSQAPRQLRLTDADHRALAAKTGALARLVTKTLGKDTPYLYLHERDGDHIYTESIKPLEREPTYEMRRD